MADIPFSVLSLDEFIELVVRRIQNQRYLMNPAFTLVLGSGFSVPLFPTAWKMVRDDIAWWQFSDEKGLAFTDYCPESYRNQFDQFSRDLWKSVSSSVPSELRCLIDAKSGLPDDSDGDNTTRAYQAIMSGQSGGGLNTADLRRDYFRALCKRVENRINLAHLYLGSLLHSQSTSEWRDLKRRPFCRTILTTNFDPLLQRALQLHNVLYFMTDQPHGGIAPPEDEDQAVHLIYTHGSVHRHHLANNSGEIAGLANVNAGALSSYLGRQGVIVVGYSGWNDTTFNAMQQCQDFRGNLYWCGREPAAQAAAGLRREVRELLSKNRNGRFYVELGSGGADALMQRLHERLVGQAPAIVANPTGLMIKELESIQWPAESESMFAGVKGMADNQIQRLRELEVPSQSAANDKTSSSPTLDWASLFVKTDQDVLKRDFVSAIARLTEIVDASSSSPMHRSQALVYRGFVRGRLEPPDRKSAISDYDLVLSMSDAPVKQRARALVYRGAAKSNMEPSDQVGAIADFNTVLSIPDAPAEERAHALVNRGFAKCRLDPPDRIGAIADYDLVLSMPDAPATHRARALFNRGVTKDRMDPPDRVGAFSDYNLVLIMPDAPVVQRAKSMFNIACGFARQGIVAQTVEWLQRVIQENGSVSKEKLDRDSDFDLVREEPEFVAFRGGLPD
ncbi:TPR end-of-group domain-containing protein [Ahniella affigens]|uniref:TPR end-of-group domain-containing protein n=1 Tax=Ahniella affigens TaxID=2021234 RepID=UPI0011B29D94|nr:SIR2 family protein [Ahniella affigens]